MLQESRRIHLADLVVELDKGELRHAVDGKEHMDLPVRMSQLTAVDVDVADRRLRKAAAGCLHLSCRQARDAVPLKTAM